MLVAIERLLVRVRQVPSRADELIELRRRLRAEHAGTPDAGERALAIEIRARKEEVTRAIGEVACCASCATGRPRPGGTFDGGHCCSGETLVLFTEDDVAALAQAGTRPRDLTPPREEHAGCAFRGPTGCTTAAGDRAAVCLRYVCGDLARELHRRGRLDEVERQIAALEQAHARFAALRARRLDREWIDALTPG